MFIPVPKFVCVYECASACEHMHMHERPSVICETEIMMVSVSQCDCEEQVNVTEPKLG